MDVARQFPKSITKPKYFRLLAQLPSKSPVARRDRLILEVMWSAGLRVAEVAALVPGDLEETSDSWVISVRKGKGGRARLVRIGDNLAGLYRDWSETLPKRNDSPLFPSFAGSKLGGGVSDRYIRKMVGKLSADAGVTIVARNGLEKPIGPHVLRHSYATRAISKGMPLHMLQRQLGHRSIRTTAIYLSIEDPDLGRVVKTIMDDDRHVDSGYADYQESTLERQVADVLGDIPAENPLERLEKAEIAAIIAEIGVHQAVRHLRTALR